jgi:hypothetical protein
MGQKAVPQPFEHAAIVDLGTRSRGCALAQTHARTACFLAHGAGFPASTFVEVAHSE